MSRLRILVFAILAFSIFVVPRPAVSQQPQPPQPGALGPPPAKPSTLDPIKESLGKLGDLLQTNAVAATTTTALPANAVAATTTGGENIDETTEQPSSTFASDLLTRLTDLGDTVTQQAAIFIENFADLPQANRWYERQINDARFNQHWRDAGRDLLTIVAVAFGGAFVFELFLMPVRRDLRRRTPSRFIGRLTTGLVLLAIELLPMVFFVFAALTMLDQREASRLARFVVLNTVYAMTLNRLVMIIGRVLLAPRAPALRLVPLNQNAAKYLYRWLRYYNLVTVYGYFCVDVAHAVHVPGQVVNAFGALLGLILVVMTIIVIIQKRAMVAVFLRGNLSAARRDISPWQNLRLWFARSWHVLAIAYLVIGYLVTALGVEGGLSILMRGTVLTFLVFAATGIAFFTIARRQTARSDRGMKFKWHMTISDYYLRLVIIVLAATGILGAWSNFIWRFWFDKQGGRLALSLFLIGVIIKICQFIGSSIERYLYRTDKDGKPVQASARMRTLLPMLHTVTFIVFLAVSGIVVLFIFGGEPGAFFTTITGVVGVAIAFGSQTLVKDFLTGLFIVIENTIAVGDVVKIGDHSGVVEAMSLRTIRLRDADGSVHILPFGEISKLVNMTRDFAYALLDIGVAYNTDLRRVMAIIRETGDSLGGDALFKYDITAPIEVQGVTGLGDYAITIRSRIRTRPGRQWDVKSAFLLRIKERFDAEKIEIPFPTAMRIVKNESEPKAAG